MLELEQAKTQNKLLSDEIKQLRNILILAQNKLKIMNSEILSDEFIVTYFDVLILKLISKTDKLHLVKSFCYLCYKGSLCIWRVFGTPQLYW